MNTRAHRISGFLLCAAMLALPPAVAWAQKNFSSPEQAAQAFVDALAKRDKPALRELLGKDANRYVPTERGAEEIQADIDKFLSAWEISHKLVPAGTGKMEIAVGKDDWTMPIPITQSKTGWAFDLRAGADNLRTRRIGRNELAAMKAAMAYYDAQKEYALKDRNGDGVLEYAQRFASTPGKRDGLYWPVAAGEEESPLGLLFVGEGAPRAKSEGYHGYHFRILDGQGPNAPGGAYDYRIGAKMMSGFGLIAWPVKYGETGVMSFIVNHDGQVYEKNLGADTDAQARKTTRFDPDRSWSKLEPEMVSVLPHAAVFAQSSK